jgi:glutamyl/glutaminyl-tRNA synthetase
MRMPDGSTTFNDLIRGDVTFDHNFVPDFVLVRADGSPLYTLAVAVDDILMKVTHVLRGEDLLSSTPRQIRVYQAMGVKLEDYPVLPTFPLLWVKTTPSFQSATVKCQSLGIAKWASCQRQSVTTWLFLVGLPEMI